MWRAGAAAQFGLNRFLRDCDVKTDYSLLDYKRIGIMLGTVALPGKKRPNVVDALAVPTAAGYGRAAILTSDPDDIAAYAATLPKAEIRIVPLSRQTSACAAAWSAHLGLPASPRSLAAVERVELRRVEVGPEGEGLDGEQDRDEGQQDDQPHLDGSDQAAAGPWGGGEQADQPDGGDEADEDGEHAETDGGRWYRADPVAASGGLPDVVVVEHAGGGLGRHRGHAQLESPACGAQPQAWRGRVAVERHEFRYLFGRGRTDRLSAGLPHARRTHRPVVQGTGQRVGTTGSRAGLHPFREPEPGAVRRWARPWRGR